MRGLTFPQVPPVIHGIRRFDLNPAIVGAGSVLVLLLIIALAREVRLRRALQHLLLKILTAWRNGHAKDREHPDSDRIDDRDPRM